MFVIAPLYLKEFLCWRLRRDGSEIVSIQESHCYFRLSCRPSCLEKAAAGGGLITRRNCLQVSSSCVPPEVPNLEHTLPGHVSEKQPDRGDGQDRAQSPNRM